MSKNTDFFKLGPYSRKNNIRTRIGTKIEQTESNRAKVAVPRALMHQQCAGSASATHAGMCQSQAARSPASVQSWVGRSGSARVCGSAWLCRRHMSSPRWSCVAPADDRHMFGACRRSPADLFFFFFLLLYPLKSVTQFFFLIFISFDP